MAEDTAPHAPLTPYLRMNGAAKAIDWYVRALAAEDVIRLPVEGTDRLMHAVVRINGGTVYLSDALAAPAGDGPLGVTIFLGVDDADRWFNRAVEAGATVRVPLADQPWGDRFGEVIDPFGCGWAFASPAARNG
jgi:PhnB protein